MNFFIDILNIDFQEKLLFLIDILTIYILTQIKIINLG